MAVPQLSLNPTDVATWFTRLWWPLLRVGGFVAVAPVISGAAVPARTKIALSLGIALLVAPFAKVPASLEIFSGAGLLSVVQQMLIGLAIGMVVQFAFDALDLAGQTISMTMGLGYANLVDPQRGATTPVLGQLFTIFATLVYLSLDGHLALLAAFARSFDAIPIGAESLDRGFLGAVANWGGRVFESGLLIALPATVALLVVNLALGVVTRAAPQLNLFGIGFPITMLAGYFVLIVGLDGVMLGIRALIESALAAASDLTAPPLGGH